MFDIGFSELLLVFVIGLIVLGPQRLPVAVKTVVGWVRALRSLATTVQNELAAELEMPVFMHCRDAHERFMALLEPWLEKLPGAVLHCFTGSRQEALDCLNRGLYLGITGWVCDERRGLELRELLPVIPADRLLLETDAPYLLPRDMQPKPPSRRNEPAYLGHIAERVAHWRGEDAQWLAAQTDDNVRRLFGVQF